MRLPSNGTVRGEGGGLRPSALPAFLAGRDSAPRAQIQTLHEHVDRDRKQWP